VSHREVSEAKGRKVTAPALSQMSNATALAKLGKAALFGATVSYSSEVREWTSTIALRIQVCQKTCLRDEFWTMA
jgi:hypothetical protein